LQNLFNDFTKFADYFIFFLTDLHCLSYSALYSLQLRIIGYSGAPVRTWMLRIGYNRSSDRIMREVMRESARPAGSPGKWRRWITDGLQLGHSTLTSSSK